MGDKLIQYEIHNPHIICGDLQGTVDNEYYSVRLLENAQEAHILKMVKKAQENNEPIFLRFSSGNL